MRSRIRKCSRSASGGVNFGVPRLNAGYNSYVQIVQVARLRDDHERDGARRAHRPARRPAAFSTPACASGTAIRAGTGMATRW